MGISVRPDPTKPARVLTGDEWEQTQYAPHRVGQDPTKPLPGGRILTGDEWEQASATPNFGALTFSAMPKIAPDATSRLNPNAGKPDRSVPEQMGAGVRDIAGGFDAAAAGLDPIEAAAAHIVAAVGRQAVAPAVEHPLLTAALANPVGAVIGTGMAVKTIAQYGWQAAHEAVMSPEDRARSEADPNRVSGEAAAVQAAMLGLGFLSGVHAVKSATDVTAGMMEAGAAGVKAADLGPQFGESFITGEADATKAAELRQAIATHAEDVRQGVALKDQVTRQNAAELQRQGDALKNDITLTNAEERQQEELTRQAALRALTGVRRRPRALFESESGAEVLGFAAAEHGLPDTASPYPPGSPLDASWKQGHDASTQSTPSTESFPEGFTMGGALTENRIPDYTPPKVPRTEPVVPPEPSQQGPAPYTPSYRNPAGLYKRLSNDALGAQYRALIEQRTAEQPNAQAPLWTPEREAEAVSQIENRRRPDGSFAAADKRELDALQAAQGEEYYVGRHTPESAAAERRVTDMTKHISAIETEFQNRGLNPADAIEAPAGSGEGSLPPIEGTGDVKTRGLALGVEQKAIAKELTDYLGDLPEYRTVNMAEQADHATRLIRENPDLARRVALGEVDAPHGLLPESVFVAVENKAIAEGDVATIRDLASGKLTEQATTMGQRIRALAERDPESPVAAIQRVVESRNAEGANESVKNAVAELKAHLDKTAGVDEETWVRFINSLRC